MDIKMRDGAVYSKRVPFGWGSPQNPMSYQDIANKFRHCCEFSAKPIPGSNVEDVIKVVAKLDTLTDVRQIVRLLG